MEKVNTVLLVLLLLGVGFLLYRNEVHTEAVSKVINIEDDVLNLNKILLRRDSIEDQVKPGITKVIHEWKKIGSQPKLQSPDSLVESVNNLLQ